MSWLAAVFTLALLALVFWLVRHKKPGYSPEGYLCGRRKDLFDQEFDEFFRKYGAQYPVDWRMIKAIAWNESKYDPCAVGKHNEIGMMQVQKWWGQHFNVDLNVVDGNVKGGTLVLDYELKEWKDELKAVAAYNGGDSRVREAVYSDPDNWRSYLLPSIQKYVKDYIETVAKIRAEYMT